MSDEIQKSILELIFDHLKTEGFEVYFPSSKVGECKTKYVVVKSTGSSIHQTFSSDVDIYDIICYVPKNKYSQLESFVREVKKSMKKMEPMVRYNNNQTPSFYDDSIKAHSVSVSYKNYKKFFTKEE